MPANKAKKNARHRKAIKKYTSNPREVLHGQPHRPENFERGGSYAKNGATHLKKAPEGKAVYDKVFDFVTTGTTVPKEYAKDVAARADAVANPGDYKWPSGPAHNFDPPPLKHPYPWTAHHIIPDSAFSLNVGSSKRKLFTYEERSVLHRCGYDLNNGTNLILLPHTASWACPIHTLLQHYHDHEPYTRWIMDEMKGLKRKVAKIVKADSCKKTKPDGLVNALLEVQQRGWNKLVDLGADVITDIAAGRYTLDDLVAFKSKADAGKPKSPSAWGKLADSGQSALGT